ncbi:hypothetical protein E4M02_11205 [Brevundimonas sp. S30B]|uniref:phage fiber-tail adaptor protein n=1 Tax=unclassified Brevundimonas TaxID=2622653 RepID=UPI001071F9ED|nr:MULTISPECIES: hypothetical protein [unclassified Brevundimonas]QBX38682.1 hypothetical protein E4M01_13465 [Brevundimonas sp. MF30-B]TFW01273.1 hypothetical protein E4M02_11205 [Brevundimonas sp. S30B]
MTDPLVRYGPDKYADEVLDYTFDWTNRLKDAAGTVVDSIPDDGVSLSESDPLVEADRITTTDNVTTFWVNAGGRVGFPLRINLLATSAAGREYGVQIVIPIRARP